MRNELFAVLAMIGAFVLTQGQVSRVPQSFAGTNELWLVFMLVFTFAVGLEGVE
ncbi:MAG: hypothetical protein GOU99_01315 [Candidatus Altiarchaeota archaeon]|nr:hypothetical protein [Candidatus Altiarchaeota archaeon]